MCFSYFQGIQQKGSALLHQVLFHKNVHNVVDVSQGLPIVIDQHLSKGRPLLRVGAHNVSQEENVVRGVSDLFRVKDDLLKLPSFGKTLDHLVGNVGPQVHGQGQSGIGGLHQIAQFFRALQLVLLQPFFQELFAALLKHWSTEFQGLEFVQLALVQEDSKVLEQRGSLARLGRNLLEFADRLRSSQNTFRSVGSDLWKKRGSSAVLGQKLVRQRKKCIFAAIAKFLPMLQIYQTSIQQSCWLNFKIMFPH